MTSLPFPRIYLHSLKRLTWTFASVLAGLLCLPAAAQKPWTPIGPDGGDARAIAAVPGDPAHLFLGTTSSLIYESTNGGREWHRLARLDSASDLVIDHIIVDPSNLSVMYAATWKFDRPDGGLWISHDAGHQWTEMAGIRGQSIRAFAQDPANPRIFVAGTLQGVFRSTDAGSTWKQISPPGSREIHEVESVAIDPRNPDVIYAGTWHLPWKTTDGGAHWENIKRGVIDDSDVFSIVIDPQHPRTVYMSACSGIYKSETAGDLFHKIQGIPSTARRTRVLRQDPVHPDTVYAGTTEGLYKTTNAGRTFRRMTADNIIVNDVFVNPRNPERVLLATDRSGVLASDDAGVHFEASNQGFSGRKVEALLVDPRDPDKLYAGVVNDKTFGGVFVSSNGGSQWKQVEEGLDGRDVFALAQAEDGTVLAGTNSGIFALEKGTTAWRSRNTIENTIAKPAERRIRGKRVTIEKKVKAAPRQLEGRIYALDLSGDAWAAASSSGLFSSRDKGATWQGGPAMGNGDYISVTAHGKVMAAARSTGVVLSNDAGETWWPMGIPTVLTRIHKIVFSADGTLWLGSREGVYFTRDLGKTWMWVHRLPLVDVSDLYYDARQNAVLVSSRGSDFIYAIDVKSLSWKWYQTGYKVYLVRGQDNRILAASLNDGVLTQPQPTQLSAGQKSAAAKE